MTSLICSSYSWRTKAYSVDLPRASIAHAIEQSLLEPLSLCHVTLFKIDELWDFTTFGVGSIYTRQHPPSLLPWVFGAPHSSGAPWQWGSHSAHPVGCHWCPVPATRHSPRWHQRLQRHLQDQSRSTIGYIFLIGYFPEVEYGYEILHFPQTPSTAPDNPFPFFVETCWKCAWCVMWRALIIYNFRQCPSLCKFPYGYVVISIATHY